MTHTPHAFVDHVTELLGPLGNVRVKRMFGGHGVYLDDLFMALIVFERLFLKADETTRETFAAAGCEPFTYQGSRGDVHVMSYWSAPAQALESSGEMRPWVRLAVEAALRARATAKPRAAKKAATAKPRSAKKAATAKPRAVKMAATAKPRAVRNAQTKVATARPRATKTTKPARAKAKAKARKATKA